MRSVMYRRSELWERLHSNYTELWKIEPDISRLEEANAIKSTDAETAFSIYLELAEQGSVIGMLMVAWHYGYGSGLVVPPDHDLAELWYIRAINKRSWLATIPYARLLASRGDSEGFERVLGDGVRKEWSPAYFWLAWLRHKQSPGRKEYPEIQRLLEYAAGRGHPAAQWELASLMMRGKFGLRQIPRGFNLSRRQMDAYWAEDEARID